MATRSSVEGCGTRSAGLGGRQMGHSPRQLELILQPRDLHARADPPVPLPVQPDEHVALRQVSPVQLARGVRPRPQLEHHRGQPHAAPRWPARPPAAPRPVRPAWSSRTPAAAGPVSGSPRRPARSHQRPLISLTRQVCGQPTPLAIPRSPSGRRLAPDALGPALTAASPDAGRRPRQRPLTGTTAWP